MQHLHESPLISVVIPTYNCAQLLKIALMSVQAQSYQRWEALVINNFSSDNTTETVQRFGDERIKIFDFANHGVIAASRNKGISLAIGSIIAFLDADDIWYPEKLQQCVDAISKGYDLVCHSEVHFEDNGPRFLVDYSKIARPTLRSMLFDGNCFSTSATVCRAETLRKVGCFSTDTNFVTAEDYELWLKLVKAGAKATLLTEALGEYRIHSASASKSLERHFLAEQRVISKYFWELPDKSPSDFGNFLRRKVSSTLFSSIRIWKQGSTLATLRFAFRAL